MEYQTYEPSKDLSDYVKSYWTLKEDAHPTPEVQRIVPDGCLEMIFHFGDNFRQLLSNNGYILQPKCFVFGQITKVLEIVPTGKTDIFSVRFHPGGFIPFSELPIKQMENRAVPLSELFGDEGRYLETEMLKLNETAERIQLAENFFRDMLSLPVAADLIVQRSVDIIMEVNGQLSVDELSEQMLINRRNLERQFSRKIGLSPKELSRMVRIQSVLRSLMTNNYENLTNVAYEFSYFDQAHFIKDFKEFTGVSPKKYFSNNLKMAALFLE